VTLHVLAYAHMHCGDPVRARAMLDQLEASGWLEALSIRAAREALVADARTDRERAITRLPRLLLVARLPEGPARQAHVTVLRGEAPRPMRALRDGWPEAHGTARALGLVTEQGSAWPEPAPSDSTH
jgi:hypothetical protein